jgi:hypothetical protein
MAYRRGAFRLSARALRVQYARVSVSGEPPLGHDESAKCYTLCLESGRRHERSRLVRP